MCNTILSSIYKLFLFSLAIFTLSCQELELGEVEEIKTGGLLSEMFPEPDERPMLKTIEIGNEVFSYESYSDGVKIVEGCYAVSDEVINKVEELSKNPDASIEDLYEVNLPNARQNAAGYPVDLYWGSVVKYYIDPAVGNQSRIRDAIKEWDQKTSLVFNESLSRNVSGPLLIFKRDGSNRCFFDRNNIAINVGDNCLTTAMKHEIGHALNLLHEHQRIDRGAHIRIKWSNVDPTKKDAFRLLNNEEGSTGGNAYGSVSFLRGNFDKNSIMMYPSKAFSKNGQPTIVDRWNGTAYNPPGYITQGDADAVEYMKSGRVDDEALILSPFNVKARYPLGKHEGDMIVTWDPVPNANAYDVYTLDHNGEFIRYRTIYNTRYKKELKDRHLAGYRIRIAAVNTFYDGYSRAVEADYNWK